MATLDHKRQARGLRGDGDLVAALDIGTSKITCLIVRVDSRQACGFSLAGMGRQQSRGFEGGVVTDMDALERAIRLAVEDAERQACQRVDRVILGVTGAKIAGRLVSAETEPGGREIGPRDVRRLQAAAWAKADARARDILCAWPVSYRVDGEDRVRDPRGMLAERFGMLMCTVSAPQSLLRNLIECLNRAHLKTDLAIPSSIASGFGALIEDERDNGALCIDMGAGVTVMSAFMNGAPAWLDLVPVGGQHVTADLAQGLGTTFAAAERLKSVSGHADLEAPGLKERIECPKLGDDGRLNAVRLPREDLARIVAPRIEETFELVARRLAASDLKRAMPRRAVLTGGASQLPGVREVASRILNMPVRLGRPVQAESLGETLASPAFSTAAGLITSDIAGGRAGAPIRTTENDHRNAPHAVVNKTLSWLRENF